MTTGMQKTGVQKTLFLVVVITGALLGLLGASRPWVLATVPDLAAGGSLRASGRQAAGVVPAVALVALAGGVAVLTTRRLGRVVAGSLLVLAGAAAATASAGVLRTPAPAVRSVVTAATGRTGSADVAATVTGWPWVGLACGVLVAVAGALAVLRARAWSGLSARYDAAPAGPLAGPLDSAPSSRPGAGDDPGLVWDALSRGDDPTH